MRPETNPKMGTIWGNAYHREYKAMDICKCNSWTIISHDANTEHKSRCD